MATKKTYDHLFKILLIGDSGVGKTQLLFALSDEDFNVGFRSTIGVDFKIRTMKIDDKRIKLQVWDTAGQERYITTAYYRGAMGIMLVYDITQDKTFENMGKWMRNIKEHAHEDVVVMLLGHHFNIEDDRVVTVEQGEELAREHGFQFREVNYRDKPSVEEALSTLVREIKLKVDGKAFENMELMDPEPPAEDEQAKNEASCIII